MFSCKINRQLDSQPESILHSKNSEKKSLNENSNGITESQVIDKYVNGSSKQKDFITPLQIYTPEYSSSNSQGNAFNLSASKMSKQSGISLIPEEVSSLDLRVSVISYTNEYLKSSKKPSQLIDKSPKILKRANSNNMSIFHGSIAKRNSDFSISDSQDSLSYSKNQNPPVRESNNSFLLSDISRNLSIKMAEKYVGKFNNIDIKYNGNFIDKHGATNCLFERFVGFERAMLS